MSDSKVEKISKFIKIGKFILYMIVILCAGKAVYGICNFGIK